MKILSYLPRIALAALFAAGSSTAVLATVATHAGAPASGLFSAAPVAALADPDDRRWQRDNGDRRGSDRGNGNRYAGGDRDRNHGSNDGNGWNNNNDRTNNNDRNNNNGWNRNNGGWNGNNNGWNGDNGRGNRDWNHRDNDDRRRDRDRH